MCELLAMSSSRPARLTFSLKTLAAHSAEPGVAPDGWGVAFYDGPDVALFRQAVPAAGSQLVRFLESQGPRTGLAISHIRHATQGLLSLANTQPFSRAMTGRMHVFAHNGHLQGIRDSDRQLLGPNLPVGETDSEWAFGLLLERLQALWEQDSPPTVADRHTVLGAFAAEMRSLGPANFLYADGDSLFVHGDRRKQQPSGKTAAPGLWVLQKKCALQQPRHSAEEQANQVGVAVEPAEQFLTLVASVPLTDEAWVPLAQGELLVVREGSVITP
ncbi:MAG: class II glutamine amidotransferase [Comamonadaceae bacterium]|nr:class II glutamine amidotransferase [Comamonadaceae bacterium]